MIEKTLSETFQNKEEWIVSTTKTTEYSYDFNVWDLTIRAMKDRASIVAMPQQLTAFLNDVDKSIKAYNEVVTTLQGAKDGLKLEWEVPEKVKMDEIIKAIEEIIAQYKD